MGTLAEQKQEQREERPGVATGTCLPRVLNSGVVLEKASAGLTVTPGPLLQVWGRPLAPLSGCKVRSLDVP